MTHIDKKYILSGEWTSCPFSLTPSKNNMKTNEICDWEKWNDCFTDDIFYDTSCNNTQSFTEGDIEENGYIFCPYCGLKIKEQNKEILLNTE